MKAFRSLALLFALLAPAAPLGAQIIPVTETSDYQIMKEDSQQVCFAATELLSAQKKPMIFTHYASTQGQRWSVAGYASAMELASGMINISVAVDGTETISRETVTRDGDFLLPFETLEELEAHEALISAGTAMSITIGDVDTVDVALDAFRVALEAMANCLQTGF